jgi:hypothetical protein
MSTNTLESYFILLFEKKYPGKINEYDKGNCSYLFDTFIKKYNTIGLDLSYYIEKFIRVVDLSSCNNISVIIESLAKYLDTLTNFKNYPWLISVINVSNKYEKDDLDIYLFNMESILSEIPKLLSNYENINLILSNCPRLLNIFKNNREYILDRIITLPSISFLLSKYCEIKGIPLKTNKIKIEEPKSKTDIIQEKPKQVSNQNIRKPVIKNEKDQFIDRYSTLGFSKSVFQLIGAIGKPNTFNYVIQNLSPLDLETLKGYFGQNFELKYNDSSVSFKDLIDKCKNLVKCYNNHVNPIYLNVDLSQNLFYILKGLKRDDIYEYLITISEERVNFLGKFFDLKTGESKMVEDADFYQLFRLSILLSDIDGYSKYNDKNLPKEIAI